MMKKTEKKKVEKKTKFIDPDTNAVDYVFKKKSTKKGYSEFSLKTSKDVNAWTTTNLNVPIGKLVDKDDIIELKLKGKIDTSLDVVSIAELYLLLDEFMKVNTNFMTSYKRKEK